MKKLFLSICSVVCALTAYAGDEPLIPTPLNSLLPRFTDGMSIDDAKAIFATAYPKVKATELNSGWVDFGLDDRYSVAFVGREHLGRLGSLSTFYIRDSKRGSQIEISHRVWGKGKRPNNTVDPTRAPAGARGSP